MVIYVRDASPVLRYLDNKPVRVRIEKILHETIKPYVLAS
ncbi:hypothetical protein SAMN05421771_2596 [Granulicella pectinivorans]|jgi:hypothetical protein|uniref:Uncharacterized protein n=1 Tax=Granulicella pectinivorans TaxID=474950 RepID=A0A1I6MGP4_9BACT|nr:hypothetical protein SAMN05421771_2596 [Granulicella pectinivorans]